MMFYVSQKAMLSNKNIFVELRKSHATKMITDKSYALLFLAHIAMFCNANSLL